MDMESSTVIDRRPVACASASLRDRQGRMKAARPWPRCPRLSLVEIATVGSSERIAGAVAGVSGAAAAKVPPSATKARAWPRCMASIAMTTSCPRARGGSKPNAAFMLSGNSAVGFSVMATVRLPWTLEWPRTGQTPAPGWPMLPRGSARVVSRSTSPEPRACCTKPMP